MELNGLEHDSSEKVGDQRFHLLFPQSRRVFHQGGKLET